MTKKLHFLNGENIQNKNGIDIMKTYRKAEAIVTQYNQDLAEWEQTVKNGQKSAEKQHRPPERQSVRNRLRRLQEEGKQNSQPKQRKKSQGRDR